jgi:putative ABC transport system permease protein
MSTATRVYGWLLRLLPRSVREHDAEEMLRTLQDQIEHAREPGQVIWRAYRRFPAVLALEWKDVLLHGGIPTSAQASRGSAVDLMTRQIMQSARSLRRTPAFSCSVILLLGLGLGGVSAVFAVVDHVLLRQLPYPAAERLIVVENGSHSVPMFRDFHTMRSIESWAGGWSDRASLTGQGDPLQLVSATVTEKFFEMFGARAQIGRLLDADDFASAQAVVLSFGAWQRIFGGDRSILGRTIRLSGEPVVVVGVLDSNFVPPEGLVDPAVDVWRPIDPKANYMTSRDVWLLSVAGRLKRGASIADAKREAARIAQERARTFPDHYADNGKATELPVITLQEAMTGDVRQGLSLLFGAVTLLLLVACANVTHLFLARGVTRIQEMAVRRAIGANTRALVGQLFTESLLLGLGGAFVGIAVAFVGVRAFLALMPAGLPRAASIHIDARVLLFAAGSGVVTAVIFGLLPALRFARGRLANPLRGASRGVIGGRATQTLRNAIVIGEVALSLVLVAQAGWLLRSFVRLNNQELGFRTEQVVTIPLSFTGIKEPQEWFIRMEAVQQSLRRVAGVRQAAYGLTMPLQWTGGSRCCWGTRPRFPGKEELKRSTAMHPISDDYFRLLEHKLVAGQLWTRARAQTQPVPAVINDSLARHFFGSAAAAIGASFTAGDHQFEVIGVAEDNRHYGADQPSGTAVYIPANATPFASGMVHMAVRTARTDARLHSELRSAIWRSEPTFPVPTIRSLDEWASAATAQRRFDSLLFIVFGGITLLLLAGGLAGTLFYMVSLQRRDLGIRLALGETATGLERVVLTRGVGMAAIGVVLGAGGAWAFGKLIESRLYGVDARDLRTLGFAVAVLMTIAFVSSWVPARRAARTSPMESLRSE